MYVRGDVYYRVCGGDKAMSTRLVERNLRHMLADLERQLAENSEDIWQLNDRIDVLYRERVRIYEGIVAIENELKRLEGED